MQILTGQSEEPSQHRLSSIMYRQRNDEKIDNMDQALERAVKNGVKNLVVQPTHLMHGAEYDELSEAVEKYKDKFESVKIAEATPR